MSSLRLGLAGSISAYFQEAHLTPLLAIGALLLGAFAILFTPREEEPQINVTMANVMIPFPGASVADIEQMVASPAEQVLSRIAGIEHVLSVSRPGLAIMTVQFKVSVPRTEALVRLNEAISSHADWLPRGVGVGDPVVKTTAIDDVPIVAVTLYAKDPRLGSLDLEHIAHTLEGDLKRVSGARDVVTIGGLGRGILVEVDPQRMTASGMTISELREALQAANFGAPVGDLIAGNQSVVLDAGPFLRDVKDVAELVVGTRGGRPVFLQDVADVHDGALPAARYVWHGTAGKDAAESPAVTISVTKKPGENAIDVADAVMHRVEELRNTVIPQGVGVAETRNYGATANDKAQALLQKLLFATASVIALVFVALGRREAAIVGAAVVLTLMATLFASWAWGFTLNRISQFALIFSIGILVDDAIVVVENIHRHQAMNPGMPLRELIPAAIDEVGGPTILATFTVIAALVPMAFVGGLMGPYLSPIPVNASTGMLLSLIIAFVVTPWLARLWMKRDLARPGGIPSGVSGKLGRFFERVLRPLLDADGGARKRRLLAVAIALLIAVSVALPATGFVVLKMLPFDNKSEFQVVVDMPAGTPVEKTASVLRDIGALLAKQPEVTDYQAYAGTAAPINFNGLMRQYYLRASGELGDVQVNLVDKAHRHEKSHAIVKRLRPLLAEIGARHGGNVKVIEVPPGPPVLAPVVAEVYGPDAEGRRQVAKAVRAVFEKTPGMAEVDDSTIAAAPRKLLLVDRRKAAALGVAQHAIVSTLRAGLAGESPAYLHDESKYPVPAVLQLPAHRQGDLDTLLQLGVRGSGGQVIPIRELVTVSDTLREQPSFHKDLLPVVFVVGDMVGAADSPLYGMFAMRDSVAALRAPSGGTVGEYFIRAPADTYTGYAVKWDGEWQVTYETFRDMGIAYAVGLLLIYLLVVAEFKSYLTPLVIMAPIPLTVVGVMPGHALMGAQFTAPSLIGMIALAGIIVRNSILLVDFINLQVAQGVPLADAVIRSATTRAQPIMLTGLAAMLGASFLLDDPIFNGLGTSLVFGILVSTMLTLVVIPLLHFQSLRSKVPADS